MSRKIISYIKEYPYFSLLLASGICVFLCSGAEQVQRGIPKNRIFCSTAGTNLASSVFVSAAAENAPDTREEETVLPEEAPAGTTEFIYYDPKEVDSPYYQDPGKFALTTSYPYETAGDDYFSDAVFIGDSRTLGLFDYSGLPNTDFYCDNGFCTYRWMLGKTVGHQNTRREVLLEEAMARKSYGKIYLMVGLNDCGYGNIDDFRDRYQALLDMLREKQPGAIVYLMANLHISREKSEADAVYNNDDINAHNAAIAELADGETYFYLNVNELFLDEQGNLKEDLTFDGVHLYADGYQRWVEYIRQHAVVKK